MNPQNLESRLDQLEKMCNEQKKKINILESRVQVLEDIESIKKLQKAYGYYLEHWMADEVIDLFADGPDVYLKLYEGTYLGKEGIRRYFNRKRGPEFLHQVMQISGIVDVESNGIIAKGRWYSWGACAIPLGAGVRQYFMNGIYEVTYVKESIIWKIQNLEYCLCYAAPPGIGWVKPERVAALAPDAKIIPPPYDLPPDDYDTKYPSGYILPFHFKHPVTGKPTSEYQRNAELQLPRRHIT